MTPPYNDAQRREYLQMIDRIGGAWLGVFGEDTEFYSANYWDLLTRLWRSVQPVRKTDALDSIGREFQVLDKLPIEKPDDPPTVDGIARQAIRMPRDDTVHLTALYARHHFVEEWTPGRFRAEGFVIGSGDLDVRLSRKRAPQFVLLGFYGKYLAILRFRGFPAIHEITHKFGRVGFYPDSRIFTKRWSSSPQSGQNEWPNPHFTVAGSLSLCWFRHIFLW